MKKFLIITLLFFICIFNTTSTKALNSKITLSEEFAIVKEIVSCWSIPIGLPNEDFLVRIKLKLEPDGNVSNTEILDYEKINEPGHRYRKVIAESILRAITLCQPLKKVPSTGYERWKELTLKVDENFEPYLSNDPKKLINYAEKKRKEDEKKRKEDKNKRLAKEKRIAEVKEIEEDKKVLKILKRFKEELEIKRSEREENFEFIMKIFEKNNNFLKLNCFKNKNHFLIFINDKLKKAVEIYPGGEVAILHTVRSNDNYFTLDFHSVSIPGSFYSKEEIIINNFLYKEKRNKSLAPSFKDYIAKYADEKIRFWIINRHTGISKIGPIEIVINDKVIVMDDTNQPTITNFNLKYGAGHRFNCSKKSF